MSKSSVKITYTSLADEVRATQQARVQCTVCRHPRRADIEDCLQQGLTAASIARTLKLGEWIIQRHRRQCMKEAKP